MGIWDRSETTDSRVGIAADADSDTLALVASTRADPARSPEFLLEIHEQSESATPDQIQKTLQDWVRQHKLKRARTVWVLPRTAYDLMLVERPPVPREDLVSALRWTIGERLDYPVSEATMAVLEDASHSGSTQSRQVHVAVAHIERLRPIVSAIHASGLHLKEIGIADLALGEIAQHLHPTEGSFGVLHLSGLHAHLCLFQGTQFDIARTFLLPEGVTRKIDLAQVVLNEVQRTLDFHDSRNLDGRAPIAELHLVLDRSYAHWLPRVLEVELALGVTILEHPAWQNADRADLSPLALGGWLGDRT